MTTPTAEQRAAAERYSRWLKWQKDFGSSNDNPYRDHRGQEPLGFISDVQFLADFALAVMQEDGGEAVTAEWLLTLGWRRMSGCLLTSPSTKDKWEMSFYDDGAGELWIKCAKFCNAPTRAQVRALLTALGIK